MTEKDYAKIIAKNLKRIAYDNDKTQQDIINDLHLKQATVSSWFTGNRVPRMDKIDLLCHYFNCRRNDIMEEYNPPNNGYKARNHGICHFCHAEICRKKRKPPHSSDTMRG